MKKKILVTLLMAIIICLLIPSVALAVKHTVSDGQTFDLSTTSTTDLVVVEAGANVTLTGTAPKDVIVYCYEKVTLTFEDVTIKYSLGYNATLTFNGTGNTLNLVGTSYISSVIYHAGIEVKEDAELTIDGTGSVEVRGGVQAAGIGGGCGEDGGYITIRNGNVTAIGGSYGAGIGGGDYGEGGTITILGGTVKAKGGMSGAGIGSGEENNAGEVIIKGGTVIATGGFGAAGIGAGIEGNGGTVTITGGNVAAMRGGYAPNDIGHGRRGSGGILSISGNTSVLLRNNACVTTTTTTHQKQKIENVVGGKLYGIDAPEDWSQGGGYIIPCTLSYDANGATGSVPQSITQHINTTISIATKGDLENERLIFKGWNTDAGGRAYGYAPGGKLTIREDTTLYALWGDEDVTEVSLNKDSMKLAQHESSVLSATITPINATKDNVVWYSSNKNVATVDQNGLVCGEGVGSATITAWADGKSDSCSVSVYKNTVNSVTISSTSLTMKPDEMASLTATVSPSDATYPAVTWKSSDSSVAEVNINGVVTAVGVGSATILAEADGVLASCEVTVLQGIKSVYISSPVEVMTVGDEVRLLAHVSPRNASKSLVTWTSKDESIARVDTGGYVTALSEGATSIVLTVNGVSDACAIVVQSEEDGKENSDNKNNNDTDKQEEKSTPEPKATSTPEPTPEKVNTGKKTIIINVDDLPEGTKAIKVSGEVIPIDGDEVEIEIDGAMQIIALDDEEVPLGYLNIQDVPVQEGKIGLPVWVLLLGVVIGAVTGGVLCIVFKKKFG